MPSPKCFLIPSSTIATQADTCFTDMPEHPHVLLTPASNQTIERCTQCIKGGFSHRLHLQFPVWQAGFHEHRVRDAEDFHNQLAYIAANPQRRRLTSNTYVHTDFATRLDPLPAALTAPWTGTRHR